MTDAHAARTHVHRPSRWRVVRARVAKLARPLLRRVWYLHPPVVLLLRASPAICLHTLATAAKPSTQRLHHRNLFTQGRRYIVQMRQDGFRLTTTSRVVWRYRQRTTSSAVLNGAFSPFGEDITRIQLDTHISPVYLLTALIVPTFVTSVIFYAPWPPAVILCAMVALYMFAFLGHRYHAALEANEMVFFVRKVLDDLKPAEIGGLNADNTTTIYDQREFEEAWQKFYDTIRRV